MSDAHVLLRRQLRRAGVDDTAAPPTLAQWQALLESVSRTYLQADQDRYTLERSLTISSREMQALYDEQRRMSESRLAVEQRRLEEARAQLVLSERLAAVGQLAAGVAHEINNPLAYVAANMSYAVAELSKLKDGAPNFAGFGDLLEAIQQAQEGAARIRHTTRDLKLFSRGEEDQRGPVEIVPILESSINMAWNEIRHRARLVKDFGEVGAVEANDSRLGQVFLNLLFNAAQAIPEGAADRNQIRVVTRREGNRAVIEIADTGIGIPGANLGRIFEPFFTTKPIGVGTGLGLSICHGIIRSVGGDIQVQSEVGRGTTFRVSLPLAGAPVSASSEAPAPAAQTRRGNLLLIDDDQLVLHAMRRTLGGEHELRMLQDARIALEEIQGGQRYDVIICDLMMPNLSGMDFHEQLSKVSPDDARRIVFLTGGAFTARAREFLATCENVHLEKPFESRKLREVIQELILQRA